MGQAQGSQGVDDAWDADDTTKALQAEILKRLDILQCYQSWGFNSLPGCSPDAEGWLPGYFPDRRCSFINVSPGPARGYYKECAVPCALRGERVH